MSSNDLIGEQVSIVFHQTNVKMDSRVRGNDGFLFFVS
jgi:hypothetical protein